MTDINVGQLSEALNDKMDRDAHNVQSPSAVIIEKQDPASTNNYTWYRKYSDGWVEQGGIQNTSSVTFPVEMADTNYLCFCLPIVYSGDGGSIDAQYYNKTTTTCQFFLRWQGGYAGINDNCQRCWQVSGIAAN